MGFNLNKKKSMVSDINVTPFVDVVLVLLVIFMITAPFLLNGIQLELPRTKEVNRMNLTATQVILSYTRTDEIFIGQDKYLKNEILEVIRNQFREKKTNILFFRADYGIRYGNVAKLISHLKRGGVSNIALVTETEDDK
ncbi:MAG: biopolymer transporter ExbD [Bacteriovoracaceae bacterium]|nr:biopolymer transporter ExbD [Bacteriovoracaceae bacterium]